MYNRLPACIAPHNAKLMKLRVEPRPPCSPFSPSQLPGGGLGLPLTLPLQLSSLSILMPAVQALQRPGWLVVREFAKSDLEKALELAPAAFAAHPLLLPLFPLSFSTAADFFSSYISDLELTFHFGLKSYEHRRRQHVQASLCCIILSASLSASLPPVAKVKCRHSVAAEWREGGPVSFE